MRASGDRMRVLGIVAEYDPFHLGHARHLRLAREAVRPDAVLIALSPCIKQRGELALLSPHDRAACALSEGADAVFALPVLWTVRDAEHYALGAVSLLAGLGATHLAFGAETDDLSLLRRTAELLENPPEGCRTHMAGLLSTGMGYPAALAASAAVYLPEAGRILSSPNNTLAVCYLRALIRLNLSLEPVLIPRSGSYHAAEIRRDSPSASSLRSALLRGWYAPVTEAVPESCAFLLKKRFLEGVHPDTSLWDALLLSRLRALPEEIWNHLADASEGLGDALRQAAFACTTRGQIISRLSGRRYPASRISRLCCYAMLGVTDSDLRSLPLPEEALLLALRKHSAATALLKSTGIRVLSDAASWKQSASSADRLSWEFWAQCCSLPPTLPMTEKLRTSSALFNGYE